MEKNIYWLLVVVGILFFCLRFPWIGDGPTTVTLLDAD